MKIHFSWLFLLLLPFAVVRARRVAVFGENYSFEGDAASGTAGKAFAPADSMDSLSMAGNAPDNSGKKRVVSRYEFSSLLMGTDFRILLYTGNDSLARSAAEKAFNRIKAIEQSLSDYREDSELSLLSATAGTDAIVPVSNDLWKVLDYALEVSKESRGAFDVTAGALTKLWRKAFRQKEMPSQSEIDAAWATHGPEHVRLHQGQAVQLTLPGLRLDMGGIAKGYAVDEAMKVLRDEGITCALVDGGGDIATGDPPPGQAGWTIDRYVYKNGEIQEVSFLISNQAVATSGDTYRYLEWEGQRYSHILDPRTGMGITARKIVTVLAPTCMEADAWATALSVTADTELIQALENKGIAVNISRY